MKRLPTVIAASVLGLGVLAATEGYAGASPPVPAPAHAAAPVHTAANAAAPVHAAAKAAPVPVAADASTSVTASSIAQGRGHARGFYRFLRTYEAANTAFVNGDPRLWLSITGRSEPVSIFGGFGGLGEAGLEEVHRRYVLAATAFRPSGAKVNFDYLVKYARGRTAYTVAIERSHVLYAGQTERTPQVLRVTMIFRHERGGWRIVHRHADTMVDLQLPSANR